MTRANLSLPLSLLAANVSKSPWTPEEDVVLERVHARLGNRWCDISKWLPGRTENGIKNRYVRSVRCYKYHDVGKFSLAFCRSQAGASRAYHERHRVCPHIRRFKLARPPLYSVTIMLQVEQSASPGHRQPGGCRQESCCLAHWRGGLCRSNGKAEGREHSAQSRISAGGEESC